MWGIGGICNELSWATIGLNYSGGRKGKSGDREREWGIVGKKGREWEGRESGG